MALNAYTELQTCIYLKKGVSQKIVNDRILPIPILLRLLLSTMDIIFRSRVEHVEESLARITYFQDASQISAPVAVIGGTPDRAQPVVVENLITLLTELMCSQDMRHAIHLEEFANHLRTERISSPSGRKGELVPVCIGIRPY